VQRGLRERFRDGAPYYVRLYFRLLGAHLRSEMQYRASFIAQILGTFLITGLDFAMVAILLTRFSALGGWVLEEVLFLYGTSTVSFAFAELLVGAFDDFDVLVVRGDFDRILLRPLPVVFQMLSGAVPVRRFGRMAQGVIAVVVALALLDLSWGVAQWAFFGLMILSGAAIFLAIFVAGATLAFWSPQSHEVVNIFTLWRRVHDEFPHAHLPGMAALPVHLRDSHGVHKLLSFALPARQGRSVRPAGQFAVPVTARGAAIAPCCSRNLASRGATLSEYRHLRPL
jgi:ABC-2 type transport system permease protein